MSQASLFAIGAFVFAITVFATLFYGYVVFSRNYGAGLPAGQVFPGFQERSARRGPRFGLQRSANKLTAQPMRSFSIAPMSAST